MISKQKISAMIKFLLMKINKSEINVRFWIYMNLIINKNHKKIYYISQIKYLLVKLYIIQKKIILFFKVYTYIYIYI